MRIGGCLALGCALVLCALAPSWAAAQACAPGRVVAPGTEGRCCWPAQRWSDADDRCIGVPECPDGWGGEGATCIRPDVPEAPTPDDDAAEDAVVPEPVVVRVSLAMVLADPNTPATEPTWHAAPPTPTFGPRRVNFNVVGGGLALALSTYGGSLAEGFLWGCSPIGYLIPGGALIAVGFSAACGSGVAVATGLAFGLGQVVGIFLMAAGATIFRRRGVALDVAFTRDGLSIAF